MSNRPALRLEIAVVCAVFAAGCGPTSKFKDPGPPSLAKEGEVEHPDAEASTGTIPDDAPASGGTSSTSGDPGEGSTSGGDGGSSGGDPGADNGCGLPGTYGALGSISVAEGFYVDVDPPLTGVELYVSEPDAAALDAILIELYAGYWPFDDFPQPGLYDLSAPTTADPLECGLCINLLADADFADNGYLISDTMLHATSGVFDLQRVEHALMTETPPRIVGTLSNVTFVEMDPETWTLVPGGCVTTLDGVTFDVVIDLYF